MSSPICEPCGAERPKALGRRLWRWRAALLAFSGALLALPALAQQPPASSDYRLESFQVGSDVFVRSLAVDPRRESLWVGTSVGALEIDLHTYGPKQTFTREQGLANEYIFAIGLDPRGHVWFGTNAGGTSTYFDGEWQTYFPMHGLADYWVYAYAFDQQGAAWIGTWNGANHYDPTSGRFTTYREELINIWVYGIAIDPRGRVWFGTEGGVSMFDGEGWRAWTHDDGLGAPNTALLPASGNTGLGTKSRHDLAVNIGGQASYNPNYVFSAQTDRLGRGIWFGTWGGGVSLFDGETAWTSYTQADGLAGNIVYSIAQEADGTLWFGTNRGVSRFDGTNWTTISHGLLGQHVYAITLGADSSVWVGTKGAVTRIWRES